MATDQLLGYLLGGAVSGLIFASVMIFFLFVVVAYLYTSYAWMILGQKLKYDKPWLAWIPFAGTSMVLQMGGFHWAWVFLYLIPILGWIAIGVLYIISNWRVFEKRKYPGWYSLSLILPKVGGILYLVALGFVTFKDKRK
ncbi:MAG TPA: hypothetical protein VJG90_05520 [Candidatus Nanoarchaeia archaeon]|nr:hypothetical protein [Candidatus Nanoarchaeia archaeon]